MTIKPLNERVLLEIVEAQEKTNSGLYIPPTAQEKTQVGKVLAVGDSDKIKIKVGQQVMYDKYAGTSIKMNDKDCLIVKMEDIIAVVE